MQREIIHIGNPILRQVAIEVPVEQISSHNIQSLIDDLIETMRFANGAGLAAIQIGILQRIFVIEVHDNPRYPYKPNIPLTVLINPQIEFLSAEQFDNYEGCLSVPNIRGIVARCPKINIKAYDRNGNFVDIVAQGITAGTFQHEYDHLNGVLFIDKVMDSKTLCTWDEFSKHHEDNCRHQVKAVIAKYGS